MEVMFYDYRQDHIIIRYVRGSVLRFYPKLESIKNVNNFIRATVILILLSYFIFDNKERRSD